jgi:hypothetical protein
MSGAFIFRVCNCPGRLNMLFLIAMVRLAPRRFEPQSDDLLVQSRLGHAGLTVITLVYVLVVLWQQ